MPGHFSPALQGAHNLPLLAMHTSQTITIAGIFSAGTYEEGTEFPILTLSVRSRRSRAKTSKSFPSNLTRCKPGSIRSSELSIIDPAGIVMNPRWYTGGTATIEDLTRRWITMAGLPTSN